MSRLLLAIAVLLAALPVADAGAAPSFLKSVDLSDASNGGAVIRSLATASDGRAVVAWGQNSEVRFAERRPGEPFGAASVMPGTFLADLPDVATNLAGDVAIAMRTSSNGVGISFRPAGGGFPASPQTLLASSTASNTDPHVALASDGTATVVWVDKTSTGCAGNAGCLVVKARRRAPDGTLGAVQTLSDPADDGYMDTGHNVDHPVLIDGQGNAIIAWTHGSLIATARSQYTYWPAGGAPEPAHDIGTNNKAITDIAMDAQGDVLVLLANNLALESAFRPGGGATGPGHDFVFETSGATPRSIISSVSCTGCADPPTGKLAFDTQGNATGVFFAQTGSGAGPSGHVRRVFTMTRPAGAGGAWSAPGSPIDTAGVINVSEPASLRVAGSAGGAAVATWTRCDQSGCPSVDGTAVEAVARPAGGAFGAQQMLSAGAAQAQAPHPGFAGEAAVVAWSRRTGSGVGSPPLVQMRPFDEPAPRLAGPVAGQVGEPLGFSVVSPWAALASASWAFGDGGVASGASVTHAFGAPGSFTVQLTATDAAGNGATTAKQVDVSAPGGGGGGRWRRRSRRLDSARRRGGTARRGTTRRDSARRRRLGRAGRHVAGRQHGAHRAGARAVALALPRRQGRHAEDGRQAPRAGGHEDPLPALRAGAGHAGRRAPHDRARRPQALRQGDAQEPPQPQVHARQGGGDAAADRRRRRQQRHLQRQDRQAGPRCRVLPADRDGARRRGQHVAAGRREVHRRALRDSTAGRIAALRLWTARRSAAAGRRGSLVRHTAPTKEATVHLEDTVVREPLDPVRLAPPHSERPTEMTAYVAGHLLDGRPLFDILGDPWVAGRTDDQLTMIGELARDGLVCAVLARQAPG